ncbi:MAG: CoA transferase, partial [Alcanivoracaceae bacterium]
ETSDGRWFSVAGLEPQFFMQFCTAIGRPDLAGKGLAMAPDVVAEVKAGISAAMKEKTFAEWQQVFAEIDSCTEPVLTFSEACEHPQIRARQMVVDVPLADGKTQKQVASPFKFSRTPPSYRFTGGQLGAHTTEVLSEQGFSGDELEALRKARAVV